MSRHWKSQAKRHQSQDEMKPQQQLYQISLMDSQYFDSNNKGIYSKNDDQAKQKHAKFVNKCSISSDKESITQWVDLCEANQKKLKNIVKQKQDKFKSKQPCILETGMYKMLVRKSKDQCDEKFMSLKELCHRYTFVNQHGSHIKQSYQKDKEVPKNGELQQKEAQFKHSIMQENYKTKHNFLKGGSQTKLPNISKGKPLQYQSNQSEYLQKILKLLSKSTERNKGSLIFSKNKIEKQQQKLKIDLRKQKNSKPKINWKNNRYNIKLQQNAQLSMSKSERQLINQKISQKLSKENSKKYMISMKSGYLGTLTKKQKIHERVSKSLQQCLILCKK